MIFDKDRITLKMLEGKRRWLHAVGQQAVNQAVEFAHIKEGTLKNSITYKLSDGTGSRMSTNYGKTPPPDAEIHASDDENYVKVGSALIYANAQEKHNGFMSKTLDIIRRSGVLTKLAKEAFK